ncbi:MAG: carboxymuconolactone decarboxylase family protein [Ferruginibacter sp.]
METRIKMGVADPGSYKAMLAMDNYIITTSISKLHQEFIKIRASQINGCAYCVHSHTNDARKLGETDERMHLISVWKEAGDVFTEQEKLLFAITEEVTLIHQHGLSKNLYEKSIELFGEQQTAQIIMAIININGWNRIGVALSMHPQL